MKRSLKNLRGYSIEAMDGPGGEVQDFLFDEDRWVIRYLEADLDGSPGDNKVFIPKMFMQVPDGYNKTFPVKVQGQNIESCPGLDKEVPVSRAYESALNKHYGVENYWIYDFNAMDSSMLYPPRPLKAPQKVDSERSMDARLRSFGEIQGYRIKAVDGIVGHIDDIIADDKDWQLIYIIADTSNWLPWSKKVMLPLDFLKDISYVLQEVSIELGKETINDAPEYKSNSYSGIQGERDVYEYLTMLMMEKQENRENRVT